MNAGAARPAFLSYAFRPFFLFGAMFAILGMALWLASLHGLAAPRSYLWHAHEMLFGFAGAALAGFLLTAVATWTGRPQVRDLRLGLLLGAWLAGRGGMFLAGSIPAVWVAVLDLAFPVLLAVLATREIVGGGSRRNYGIAAAVWLLALSDTLYHLGALGLTAGGEATGIRAAWHLFLVLITVVAGRIIPAFTANWLRARHVEALPLSRRPVEIAALAGTGMTAVADTLNVPGPVGWLALLTACAHAVRLAGWRGLRTRSDPLLFVLHAAYAWLVVGYLMLGLSSLDILVSRSGAVHALTVGAIASMVLAVASRVALGHTGRALHAAVPTIAAYALLFTAAILRSIGPAIGAGLYLALDLAAAAWMGAFAIFLIVYWPVLTGPRVG